MTANASGAASSKSLQKTGRAAATPTTDADIKNKAVQSARDPPEAATVSGEEPLPTRSLKARAANVYNAEWSPQEQAALDQAAVKFPAERYQPFERYVRIAAALPRKGVRDVALRLRWLSQARKRKISEDGPNKRLRRDRCQSIFATQQKPANMMPQWPQPQMPMPQLDDHGATTVGAVGGLVAQLLEQNLHILYQYKQNMHQFKVQENTELLVRFRDNILAVLNQMSSMDGVMSQMPQLPVRMNVELANNFLPAASGSSPMFPMGATHMASPGMSPVPGMPSAVPGMTPAAPGMSTLPGMSSVPRMSSAQGMGPVMPAAPMQGTPTYMGGQQPHAPSMAHQAPLSMGPMSAAMPGMAMQSMPQQSMAMQSMAMQGMAVQSMQSMGSAAMPAASTPVTGQAQHQGQHQAQNGAISPVTGTVMKAGPPPVPLSSRPMATPVAAPGTAMTSAGMSAHATPPAQHASSSSSLPQAAPTQQTPDGVGQAYGHEQAAASDASQGGLRAVASAVSSGKSGSPAGSKSTSTVAATAKTQSAASKSLAASASKVAAGMANKAAAAKASKQTKSKP